MKRKLLALALSVAMVFSLVPATSLQAEEIAAKPQAEQLADTQDAADDLALTAAVSSDYTSSWEKLEGINTEWEPTVSNGGTQKGWGNWQQEAGSEHWVQYDWEDAVTTQQMQIYWYDDGGDTRVPATLKIQYRNADSEAWTDATMVTDYADAQELNAYNIININTITAKSIRLLMTVREGAAAMGIYRWKVMQGQGQAIVLRGVEIEGSSSMGVDVVKEYTGKTVPASVAEGATFEWSVSPADVAVIQGASNSAKVTVKGLKAGDATLKLKVTKDGVSKEKEQPIHVEGIEEIVPYETATAAGVAPILPDSVVAKGLVFDDPTPSLKTANNNVDLGESFNSKLIPVKWDAVNAADYGTDKVGSTFTVTGKATHEGREYPATAKITVKKPAAAAESNRSVTFENVQLNDAFWAPKQETNAFASLDKAIYEISQPKGGEPNFDNAIKKLNGEAYNPFSGYVFQDSDIYKSIEAISYTLSATQNETGEEIEAQRKKLQDKLDSWISKIEQVQYADGYIDTFFTLRSTTHPGGESTGTHRWKNFANHEMYNAGHFLEGVVAYTRYREGIGQPDYRLYVAGKRFADEIVTLFGEHGTRHEVPGHEEIELALVKFGKLAEEYEGEGAGQSYYDTAKIFVDRRGEGGSQRDSGYYGDTYSQDRTKFVEETNAKGHSVRAGYFYAGVTDVATTLAENDTDRQAYLKSLDAIWDSVTYKKTYVTGGIGTTAPSSDSEGFGDDYVLPNDQSYCEICAAISMANWNQRMNLLYEDGKYADSVEKALYNAILVGTNLDGNRFYYSTLLEAKSGNWRNQWFECACCPPNLMRTIAALGGYMYTVHKDNVFVNMYVGSNGNTSVDGVPVSLVQETDYPWSGAVKLTVNPQQEKAFNLKLRIPGWVQEQTNKNVTIKVNGTAVNAAVDKGYASVGRTWKKGDVVTIDIPMEIRKTEADPNVVTNKDRVALQRGPIVYSLEKAGNAQLNPEIENFDPLKVVIPRDARLKATYNKDLLKGVVEITGDVKYSMYGELLPVKIQAVPYYAWNNRGDDANYVPGEVDKNSSKMLIWTMADKAQSEVVAGAADDAAPDAKVSSDKVYTGARIEGVHDTTFNPSSSSLGNGLGWSNWTVPRDDTEHWLMYEWDREITTKQLQIYWYENNPWDRHPGSLRIEYKDANGAWKEAKMEKAYKGNYDKLNTYNVINIDEVTTKALRLMMTVNLEDSQTQSIGCYRWKVMLDKNNVAKNVVNMIDKIGKVEGTLASRKLIYDARMAYESLSEELKAMVTNYSVLTTAEENYTKATAEAAKPVVDLIDKIGTVQATAASKKLIDDARKAYDALSMVQKAAVTNYNVLLDAEIAYEDLSTVDPGPGPQPTVIDISKASIGSIAAQKYTGKAIKPAIRVTYNGNALRLNKDYTVAYSNNTKIGTAKVTITGKGSYKGTKSTSFSITVKKNSSYTVGNYKYKITNANTKGKGTVTLTGVKSKSTKSKLKKITVAASVKIGGKNFAVTAIGSSAFKDCKKATSATIGSKVKTIGSKAFYNCKNLKKITIKSSVLKKVGKNAFKGISKKAVIKVPKKKLKAYQKTLRSKGQAKTVKIK